MNSILRRLRGPALFLLSPLALAAQKDPFALSQTQSFQISGVVVDRVSGQALEAAEIEMGVSQSGRTLARTLSGADGRFRFENVRPGKYWLAGERRGFPRQAFEQHGNFFTAIVTGPNLESENLVFRLQPEASISGKIMDEQNEPVPSVQVMLIHQHVEEGQQTTGMRMEVTTDDQGSYHFGHLVPGTYFVAVKGRPWYARDSTPRWQAMAQTDGDSTSSTESEEEHSPLDVAYPLTYYSSTTDSTAATPIPLRAGERATADIILTAVPAVHVRIRVPPSRRQDPGNVSFEQRIFSELTTSIPSASTRMIPDVIEVGGLAPGNYLVRWQSMGKRGGWREQELDLVADTEIMSPTESIRPTTIAGVVRMNGLPIEGKAVVRLWKPGSDSSLQGQVSSQGQFQLENHGILPGRYQVQVLGLPRAVLKKVSATGARVEGQSLILKGGEGAIGLALDVSASVGQVAGWALSQGKPAAGVMIVLVPADPQNNPGLIRRDQSDSDGSFTLRQVLPGHYTLIAMARGWDLEWLNPSLLDAYRKRGQGIEINGNRKYQVRVKVQ